MMSVMRSIVLAAPLAALLAACGNGPVVLSEEEKAARVTVNPFQENLTPDPALAASTITLPAAQPSGDWLQAGANSAKVPGNVAAAPEFREAWRIGVGRTSMYALIDSGEIPTVRIGRRRLVTEAALVEYLEV